MYFFSSFLLCITAIKYINLLGIFTVQIQCLLAHFLFLWRFQHGVCSQLNLCGRQLCATVLPINRVALLWSYSAPHWSWLTVTAGYSTPVWGALEHSHVNPTEHIQHKATRHHHDGGTWLTLQHILGALGCRTLKHACPLVLQPVPHTMAICPHFQGEGSLLQRIALGRLLAAQKSQTNGQVSLPPAPAKFPGGKSQGSMDIFLWLGIWCQFLLLFHIVAQIFGFINPEPGHLSPVEQVSRIYSIETQSAHRLNRDSFILPFWSGVVPNVRMNQYQAEILPNSFQSSLKELMAGKSGCFFPLSLICFFTIPFKNLVACWEEHPVSSHFPSSRWNKGGKIFLDWVYVCGWPLLCFYSTTGSWKNSL